jgi:AcrR family transcriptional regulator
VSSSSDDKTSRHTPPRIPEERPGRAGGKRDANRRKKVQKICDASLELFCENGVETVTIDQVVNKAEIPKGSFYRYFSGKEEVVETIFAPIEAELKTQVEESERALSQATNAEELTRAYTQLALQMARLTLGNVDIMRLYLQENRAPDVGARRPIIRIAREMEQYAYRLTEVAREHGLLRTDLSMKVCALTSLGATERLLFAHVSGDEIGAPLEVARDLISAVVEGVRIR